MIIHRPIIYLISGAPNNGKTSLSLAFCHVPVSDIDCSNKETYKEVSIDDGIYLIITDFEIEFIYKDAKNIDKLMRSKKFDPQIIIDRIEKIIENISSNTKINEIIIEGTFISYYYDDITNMIKKYGFIVNIDVVDFNADVNGNIFSSSAIPEVARSKKGLETKEIWVEAIGNWKDTCGEIRNLTKDSIINSIIESNVYHTFDDLGVANIGGSNTREKWIRSGLSEISEGKRILDVGCYLGYYSIRLMENKASCVIGIDINGNTLSNASIINNSIYKYVDITYGLSSFEEFKDPVGFDIILMGGIFHYFREHQQFTIDKAYNMLNKNGVLVVEIGVSSTDDDILIKRRSVDVDGCWFPNKRIIPDMFSKFEKTYEMQSVDQPGDDCQRTWFHFKK